MMIPCEKLKEWSMTVDTAAAPFIQQFCKEAEEKMLSEVNAAKSVLKSYGYKVYEDQHHEPHKL